MTTPPDTTPQDKPPESDHDVLVEIRAILRTMLNSQISTEQEVGMLRKMQRKLAGL